MARAIQPHLLTNPQMDDPALVGQFEYKLLPHVAASLAVIRLQERNKQKIAKARERWAKGTATQ